MGLFKFLRRVVSSFVAPIVGILCATSPLGALLATANFGISLVAPKVSPFVSIVLSLGSGGVAQSLGRATEAASHFRDATAVGLGLIDRRAGAAMGLLSSAIPGEGPNGIFEVISDASGKATHIAILVRKEDVAETLSLINSVSSTAKNIGHVKDGWIGGHLVQSLVVAEGSSSGSRIVPYAGRQSIVPCTPHPEMGGEGGPTPIGASQHFPSKSFIGEVPEGISSSMPSLSAGGGRGYPLKFQRSMSYSKPHATKMTFPVHSASSTFELSSGSGSSGLSPLRVLSPSNTPATVRDAVQQIMTASLNSKDNRLNPSAFSELLSKISAGGPVNTEVDAMRWFPPRHGLGGVGAQQLAEQRREFFSQVEQLVENVQTTAETRGLEYFKEVSGAMAGIVKTAVLDSFKASVHEVAEVVRDYGAEQAMVEVGKIVQTVATGVQYVVDAVAIAAVYSTSVAAVTASGGTALPAAAVGAPVAAAAAKVLMRRAWEYQKTEVIDKLGGVIRNSVQHWAETVDASGQLAKDLDTVMAFFGGAWDIGMGSRALGKHSTATAHTWSGTRTQTTASIGTHDVLLKRFTKRLSSSPSVLLLKGNVKEHFVAPLARDSASLMLLNHLGAIPSDTFASRPNVWANGHKAVQRQRSSMPHFSTSHQKTIRFIQRQSDKADRKQ